MQVWKQIKDFSLYNQKKVTQRLWKKTRVTTKKLKTPLQVPPSPAFSMLVFLLWVSYISLLKSCTYKTGFAGSRASSEETDSSSVQLEGDGAKKTCPYCFQQLSWHALSRHVRDMHRLGDNAPFLRSHPVFSQQSQC